MFSVLKLFLVNSAQNEADPYFCCGYREPSTQILKNNSQDGLLMDSFDDLLVFFLPIVLKTHLHAQLPK